MLGRSPDRILVRPVLGSPDVDGPVVSRPDGDANVAVGSPWPGSPLLYSNVLVAHATSSPTNQMTWMALLRECGRDPCSLKE